MESKKKKKSDEQQGKSELRVQEGGQQPENTQSFRLPAPFKTSQRQRLPFMAEDHPSDGTEKKAWLEAIVCDKEQRGVKKNVSCNIFLEQALTRVVQHKLLPLLQTLHN